MRSDVTTSPGFRFPATRPELPPMEAWRPFVEEAYAANWFTNFGRLSRRLETALAETWAAQGSICVCASSGTAALTAPLIANGVEGRVIVPAFTFPATLSAVIMAGARPELVDVAADTWTPSPEMLSIAFDKSGAGAAIVVQPFGLPRDFSEHLEVARAYGAFLVIDNAAGLGASRSCVGPALDAFEASSMHATKPFGIGEGGAIFAHADNEARLRSALNFGLPDLGAGDGPNWGVNGKMPEVQAAIGLAVAETFEARVAARRAFVGRYISALAEIDGLVIEDSADQACWQLFPVLMPSERAATAAVAAARDQGMEIRRYYRPALSSLGWLGASPCPISEDLAARMICLPVYSRLSGSEADEMAEIAQRTLRRALFNRGS